MRVFWTCLVAAFVVGSLAPALALGADTPASLYDCRARDPKAAEPPPQPELPPEVAAALTLAKQQEDFEPLCAQGEVPYPKRRPQSPKVRAAPTSSTERSRASRARGRVRGAVSRRRARGRRAAGAGRRARSLGGNNFWYSWAEGDQSFTAGQGVNGLWALQTNEQPYVNFNFGTGAHSIGQLWAINDAGTGGCRSTTETGWSESLGQFGDVEPHLFIAAFDCGTFIGYAGSGAPWVQSSPYVFPNAVVSHNDVFHVYGTRMDGNNWWFYYDGQWVGYIPHSAWQWHFPYVIKLASAGGEVATTEYATCTDMGYAGLFGTNPYAAMFSPVWYEYNYSTQTAYANLYSYASDQPFYHTGNWALPPNHGHAFRYGGPGWC